ncbi:acyl-[acyl-carrier-protein] thioesterase [Algoriphagus confluentis]|uniref:Thioesterase n=1 Tax=Algoriphagus confluentis TaxID=1697556 RepID=A0ABQ6PQZ8_9BACT|nr:thioesterase [Algoriphagus confluentis]
MSFPEDFQFAKKFEVGSYQVHPHGAIRLSCLADLLQEIAWRHADSGDFGRNLLANQQMWVLSRLEINMIEPPKWGDQLQIFTGGRGAEKLFAFREFLVWDKNQRPIARAMSSWLLLNSETKRIQRPESVLPAELFDPNSKPAWIPQKLELAGEKVKEETIRVQNSDLDLYQHVNNTSYIRWVENILAGISLFPKQIKINYLSECHAGDQMTLSLGKLEDGFFISGATTEKAVFLAEV